MDQEQLKKVEAFIAENKGKRKFTQSVELAVNFRGIDFSKTDNRLNIAVALPQGKGKESKVAAFTDDANMVQKLESLGARIIRSSELPQFSSPAKQSELLNYELIAQPSMMPQVAKALGQFLGPRNKMPRPIVGDPEAMVRGATKSIYIRSKGKYLPTVHCMIGTESMPVEHITANMDAVMNELIKKVGKQSIRSVYLKLTMSKPLKVM